MRRNHFPHVSTVMWPSPPRDRLLDLLGDLDRSAFIPEEGEDLHEFPQKEIPGGQQQEGVSQLWISSWMALSHAAQKRKSMLAVSAAQPTNTSTTLKHTLFFQDGAHARSGHWVAHQSL
jgi:hypothetical protein